MPPAVVDDLLRPGGGQVTERAPDTRASVAARAARHAARVELPGFAALPPTE